MALGLGETATLAAQTSARRPAPRTGKRVLALWGTGIEAALPGAKPEEEAARVRQYLDRCVRHGVTRLVPSRGGGKPLVEAARARGLEVYPYLAFNSHGGRTLAYTWSFDYIHLRVDTPQARRLLDRHRPVWGTPTSTLAISDFARAHPELWARRREAGDLEPGEKLTLSLAIPEAREHELGRYAALQESAGDGVSVEFTLKNEDEAGADTSGYEPAMVAAFRAKHGRDPLALANTDAPWVQFRADQTTSLLRDLRAQVKAANPKALVTASVIARPPDRYLGAQQDWPAWVAAGILDEFCLWFRTTDSLTEVERATRHAADEIRGRCPLIAELSCYHVGSFQQGPLLLEAARRARASGADAVGVYRSDAVDQLGLWPVVEQIGKL
jgi:hypothetical protein